RVCGPDGDAAAVTCSDVEPSVDVTVGEVQTVSAAHVVSEPGNELPDVSAPKAPMPKLSDASPAPDAHEVRIAPMSWFVVLLSQLSAPPLPPVKSTEDDSGLVPYTAPVDKVP